jgi:hypothetical protein
MSRGIRELIVLPLIALAACTGGNNGAAVLSAAAPLHLDGGELVIDTASATSAGALSSTDWSAFDAKVSSVSAGAGLAESGSAKVPGLSVVYGTDANTAAEGNDPRFSDARAPTPGSNAYIQNGATPQSATSNITGDAVAGALIAPYAAIGSNPPNASSRTVGTLALLGATSWGLETSESPGLQIIDRTNNVRRAIFDTSGNAYLGGTIGCVSGCSAGFAYTSADATTTLAGPVRTQQGRVEHDAALFQSDGSTDTTPVHIKTTINVAARQAFRFSLSGYNWGADTEVESVCVGTLVAGGLTGHGCTDKQAGITTSVYVSSDGFLTVRASSPNLSTLGFSLTAAYYSLTALDVPIHIDYKVVRSAANL